MDVKGPLSEVPTSWRGTPRHSAQRRLPAVALLWAVLGASLFQGRPRHAAAAEAPILSAPTYARILTPPGYTNATYAGDAALELIRAGLSGRTIKVAVGGGTVTASRLAPNNFLRILNTTTAARWARLPAGSAMPVATSDVGGLLAFVFAEVCKPALGDCTVQYYWPKLPTGMTTADSGLNFAYLLDGLGLDAVGRDSAVQHTRRAFMHFSTAYETLRYQVVAPRALIRKKGLYDKLFTWLHVRLCTKRQGKRCLRRN